MNLTSRLDHIERQLPHRQTDNEFSDMTEAELDEIGLTMALEILPRAKSDPDALSREDRQILDIFTRKGLIAL